MMIWAVFHTDYSAHGLEPANPGKISVGEKYTLACSDPTHVTTHFNTLDIGKGRRAHRFFDAQIRSRFDLRSITPD